MIEASFQNQSGRVIATLRLALALIFLAALYADPDQPTRAPQAGYLLLVGYVLVAIALLRTAWVSWWYDFRLALPAYALDVTIFSMSIWFTESLNREFSSPFTAFFVFLLVSSTLRWSWRETALAVLVAMTGFLFVGSLMVMVGQDVAIHPLLRRLSYMIVIGLSFVFFGMQRAVQRREGGVPRATEGDPLEAAVRFVAHSFEATKVALLWEDRDEPAVALVLHDGSIDRIDLALPPVPLAGSVELFDLPRARELVQPGSRTRLVASRHAPSQPLAELAGIEEGLSTALASARGHRGQLVVGGIAALSVDLIERIEAVADQVLQLIEGRKLAELERDRAVVQTREALARDLHDSVAQALSGASFGLEALRRSLPEGAGGAHTLLADLKLSLRSEQASIRQMIERLRLAPEDVCLVDLCEELDRAAAECRQRWGIAVTCNARGECLIAAPLAYECNQILREAVSNAVRHGGAKSVRADLSVETEWLVLTIANDGAPFRSGGEEGQPWTIRQRVDRLGGTAHVSTGDASPSLLIELPTGRRGDEDSPR